MSESLVHDGLFQGFGMMVLAAVFGVAGEALAQEPQPESAAELPAPDEPTRSSQRTSGVAAGFRAGPLLTGSGEVSAESECSGGAICAEQQAQGNFDEAFSFGLEMDVLFRLGKAARLGLGALIVPTTTIEPHDGSNDLELGAQLMPLAIAEGVAGGKVAGVIRGFGGLGLLLPGGDLEDLADDLESVCDQATAGTSCEVGSGPYLGYTLGASAGIIGRVSEKVGLRGDVVMQYWYSSGPSMEASDSTGSAEMTSSFSGTRFWLMAGLEL